METIWKFPLEVTDRQVVEMPEKARLLTVQVQAGIVYLWALVNPANRSQMRGIGIFGTGQPIPIQGEDEQRA